MRENDAEFIEEIETGTPAWMLTYGDLMCLLLCFFVLLLSFSEMDRNKYRIVSGSMKNAFGIQRKKPIFDSPKGQKMISKEFDQAIVLAKVRDVIDPIKQQLEEDFKEFKASVEIAVVEKEVTIRILGEATFNSGQAKLKKEFAPLLLKIGEVLNKTRGDIIIAGHTDNVPLIGGQYGSNLGLSMARAGTVAEYLLKSTSIDPKRLSTMGFGEYRPIASNDTVQGRKKNRRVEIILTM